MQYIDIIETYLFELGKQIPFLSSFDIKMIQDWEKKQIPLYIALKGIRQRLHIYERYKKDEDNSFPRHLSYFDSGVQKLFAGFIKRMVGDKQLFDELNKKDEFNKKNGASKSSVKENRANKKIDIKKQFIFLLVQACNSAQIKDAQNIKHDYLKKAEKQDTADDDFFAFAIDVNNQLTQLLFQSMEQADQKKTEQLIIDKIVAQFPQISTKALKNKLIFEKMEYFRKIHNVEFISLRELSK